MMKKQTGWSTQTSHPTPTRNLIRNFSSLFFTAEGQAQSKKLARRKAAIIVLEEMKKVIEAEEKEKPQQECSFIATKFSVTFCITFIRSSVSKKYIYNGNMNLKRAKVETKRRLPASKKKKKLLSQIYLFIRSPDWLKSNRLPKELIIIIHID